MKTLSAAVVLSQIILETCKVSLDIFVQRPSVLLLIYLYIMPVTTFSFPFMLGLKAFASSVLALRPNPRHGSKTDNAHPPIHPTKYTNGLQVL